MSVAASNPYQFRFSSYYLFTSRCVRGAYLCGVDPYTGSSCDHRRQWIVDTLEELSGVYCIAVEALRVRAGAYQLVLRVDHADAAMLSNHELMHRWQHLHRLPAAVRRYLSGREARDGDHDVIAEHCQQWRQHIIDVGKYVGHLNQTLSRRANLEDGCTGRFWEPRTRLRPLRCTSALHSTIAVIKGARSVPAPQVVPSGHPLSVSQVA